MKIDVRDTDLLMLWQSLDGLIRSADNDKLIAMLKRVKVAVEDAMDRDQQAREAT